MREAPPWPVDKANTVRAGARKAACLRRPAAVLKAVELYTRDALPFGLAF